MYVEKTDTYTCDFCGHNAKWDASDDVHGELWSCEAEGCGKVFCSKCFISAFGQEIYMTMMQSGENVLCPECAKKKYKKENEKCVILNAICLIPARTSVRENGPTSRTR